MRRLRGSWSVVVIAAISLVAALWEMSRRDGVQRDKLRRRADINDYNHLKLLAELYPDSPRARAYRGYLALLKKDAATARRLFEEAIAANRNIDGEVLRLYAECLILDHADQAEIDRAVEMWRRNDPDSARGDPRLPAEGAAAASTETEPATEAPSR